MSERGDVLILGGGIVGVASALELARRGVAVTVLDRGAIGHGCSYANAGWLTPSVATPLPAPGMLLQCLRWMLDPESPLHIKPSFSPSLAAWLFRFLRSMNARDFHSGASALMDLSKYSLEVYESLARELPDDFGFRRRGLLIVGQTEAGVASARKEAELALSHGIPAEPLDEEGIRAREPAITGRVRGGVHFTGEAHVEPYALVRAMTAEAARRGARFVRDAEAYRFETAGQGIEGVLTTRGRFTADRYVLAVGSWSKSVARLLSLRLPVLGGKGYAVIVPPPDPMPRIPIKIVERRIAITPREDSLRLAGTLEVVDGDEGISPRRVDAIVRGSREILNIPERPEIREVWRGLRPCTPDGMPVIGFPRAWRNLLVATGHQMTGLHTAPGTARLVADLLTGAPPAFDPAPFRADRFQG
jgi:D-amino-acid dehydrogenase